MKRTANCAVVGGVLLLALTPAQADDWPQFRGPNGAGVARDANAPVEWSVDKNVKWKAAIPGQGWSSPIVWGDRVFVTTAVTEKQERPMPRPGGGGARRPGGGGGGGRNRRPPDALYRWEVHCLDRSTGSLLWKQVAIERKPPIPTHRTNGYATETPVTDGERVYAYFGMIGLFCYDMTGKLLWKQELDAFPMTAGWGTGSSPVLDGERLYIQCDNEQKSFLAAFDKHTGKELWRVPRRDRSGWATPFVWKNGKRTDLVAGGNHSVTGYDPATGKMVWTLSGLSGRCAASPVADSERLYFGTGGSRGRRMAAGDDEADAPAGGGPLYAIRAGATGDISLKDGETSNDGVAWRRDKAGPSMASPLLYQGRLYVLEQRGGMLSCYDARTGEPVYSRERLQGARGFTSSPWAYGDRLFCLDDGGQTFVVQAGPEFKLLGKNPLQEMFWSSPAVAKGALFLRGAEHLFCIAAP